jgi:hypothetical protein
MPSGPSRCKLVSDSALLNGAQLVTRVQRPGRSASLGSSLDREGRIQPRGDQLESRARQRHLRGEPSRELPAREHVASLGSVFERGEHGSELGRTEHLGARAQVTRTASEHRKLRSSGAVLDHRRSPVELAKKYPHDLQEGAWAAEIVLQPSQYLVVNRFIDAGQACDPDALKQ